MRITSIHAENFLGIRRADIELQRPVMLFAGPNAAGKSSLQEAVRMALCGEAVRVKLKKEYSQLVHGGAKSGFAEVGVVVGDIVGSASIVLPAGKVGALDYSAPAALPFVLDAQRFASMAADERRKFLFALMGVKMDAASIKARLLARDCNADKVERVAPMLRAGFDAASKDAKAKATEAKGAWRQITGETYGAVKAEGWRAPVPAYDAKAAADLATELQHLDVAIEQWTKEMGSLENEQARRTQLQTRLGALRETAALLGRRETKLGVDEAELSRLDGEIERAQAAAGGTPRTGLIHDLAAAVAYLLPLAQTPMDQEPPAQECDAEAALNAYEREHGPVAAAAQHDAEAAARLPALRQARATCASAVANDKRDIDVAKAAAADVATIEAELAETFDAAGLANAREQVADLKRQRAEKAQQADAMKSIKAAVEAADSKTKQAAEAHFAVLQWDAIGDALAPSGIPAELLDDALGPLNERLAASALETYWPRVGVDGDMQITCGDNGRPYHLLSESEQWRCDAMLAEAVSHLSGLRLLVLDRFDVLDLQGRSDLLGWLEVLAQQGELETALLFGTLKAQPLSLPDAVASVWIADGVATTEPAAVAQAA